MMDAEKAGSSIDRMYAQTGMMQARLNAMKALQPVTEALYKALTPSNGRGPTLCSCCSAAAEALSFSIAAEAGGYL